MGLDQHLRKHTYVKNWEYMKPEEITTVTVKKDGKPVEGIDPKRICYVIEEVAYWRKANQIHKWFEDTAGLGDSENGREMFVNREDLTALLGLVKEVLKSSKLVKGMIQNGSTYRDGKWEPNIEEGEYIEDPKVAKELLPTTEGFFFGSTEYDQYYIADLKYTESVLMKIPAEGGDGGFYYEGNY